MNPPNDESLLTGATPGTEERITIVLVDDHEDTVDLLDRQPDMAVVAVCGTAVDAVQHVERHRPDVVIVDDELPGGDGAPAAARVARSWPEARVIVVTESRRDQREDATVEARSVEYLARHTVSRALPGLVRRLHANTGDRDSGLPERLPRVDELSLHYQPVVQLGTGAIVGFESLVRWAHPTLGLILPGSFIGRAEETSLIADIGERVRADACRQAVDWGSRFARDPELFMGVNLSGRELQLVDLPARMRRVIDETGMRPELLVLEVTETFLAHAVDDNAMTLDRLRELGVRIALDDFGTAYSSLEYLRRFPIDIIKLDKSFTDDLPGGERTLRLIESVLHLTAEMGAVAEAEGIESREQVECLVSIGWELGQGYYFSHPVPAAALEPILADPTARLPHTVDA